MYLGLTMPAIYIKFLKTVINSKLGWLISENVYMLGSQEVVSFTRQTRQLNAMHKYNKIHINTNYIDENYSLNNLYLQILKHVKFVSSTKQSKRDDTIRLQRVCNDFSKRSNRSVHQCIKMNKNSRK